MSFEAYNVAVGSQKLKVGYKQTTSGQGPMTSTSP